MRRPRIEGSEEGVQPELNEKRRTRRMGRAGPTHDGIRGPTFAVDGPHTIKGRQLSHGMTMPGPKGLAVADCEPASGCGDTAVAVAVAVATPSMIPAGPSRCAHAAYSMAFPVFSCFTCPSTSQPFPFAAPCPLDLFTLGYANDRHLS